MGGCNCGGSTRQTSAIRAAQAEQAARRQGTTLTDAGGYYFTGPPRPPAEAKPEPAAAK